MLVHDMRLAFRSLKRNPILSALMIGAIAVGIAASMIALRRSAARSARFGAGFGGATFGETILDVFAAAARPARRALACFSGVLMDIFLMVHI